MKTSIWSVVGDDDLPQAVSEAVSESPSFRESSRRVISIHIDHLEPDPNQPRKYIPQHVIKLRREQMLAQGQLTPITVYPLDENDHYIILDGECRWRAAVSARNDGLKELNYLQAVIDEGNPEDGYTRLIKQLMHNDDGSEPLTIIEKAVAYKTLMDEAARRGITAPMKHVAEQLGISQSVISRGMAIAEMPENIVSYALSKGIADGSVIEALKKSSVLGENHYVEMKRMLEFGLDRGANLRTLARDTLRRLKQEAYSAKKSKKQNHTAGKKKVKRQQTLKVIGVSIQKPGSTYPLLVIETPRANVRLNLPREMVAPLQLHLDQLMKG